MDLLTTKQVAEELKLSLRQVQTLIQRGHLPAQKLGRDYAVRSEDLELVRNRPFGRPKSKNPSKAALAKRRQREQEAKDDK